MVKVKICGITNLEDALVSIDAGCDAVGFAFYKKSPRYISPQEAGRITRALPKGTIKIGVFVNSPAATIRKIARLCDLDILQFHGDESPEFCRRFGRYKIIKAFRVKDRIVAEDVLRYDVFAYLFDTFTSSRPGGTGRRFDWSLLKHINCLHKPIFLSGGLNAGNVRRAIKTAHPEWVDVCSSVEIRPGKKSRGKVRKFITAAKQVLR